MIIHFVKALEVRTKTPAGFDYVYKISVPNYKIDNRTKGNTIIVKYNEKVLHIPLSNISVIEE